MFDSIRFTDSQRRAIYFALATAIALGALFFSLSRGNAAPSSAHIVSGSATAGTKNSLALTDPTLPPAPVLPATIVIDVAGKVLHSGSTHLPKVLELLMQSSWQAAHSKEYR